MEVITTEKNPIKIWVTDIEVELTPLAVVEA